MVVETSSWVSFSARAFLAHRGPDSKKLHTKFAHWAVMDSDHKGGFFQS